MCTALVSGSSTCQAQGTVDVLALWAASLILLGKQELHGLNFLLSLWAVRPKKKGNVDVSIVLVGGRAKVSASSWRFMLLCFWFLGQHLRRSTGN